MINSAEEYKRTLDNIANHGTIDLKKETMIKTRDILDRVSNMVENLDFSANASKKEPYILSVQPNLFKEAILNNANKAKSGSFWLTLSIIIFLALISMMNHFIGENKKLNEKVTNSMTALKNLNQIQQ